MFLQWLLEPRAICKKTLSTDLELVHGQLLGPRTHRVCNAGDTRCFYGCPIRTSKCTHPSQPQDSFIVQKFQKYWRKEWEAKRIELLRDGARALGENASENLLNQGKQYGMSLSLRTIKHFSFALQFDLYTVRISASPTYFRTSDSAFYVYSGQVRPR